MTTWSTSPVEGAGFRERVCQRRPQTGRKPDLRLSEHRSERRETFGRAGGKVGRPCDNGEATIGGELSPENAIAFRLLVGQFLGLAHATEIGSLGRRDRGR